MMKGLFFALLVLFAYDMAFQHGVGTHRALGFFSHAFRSFDASFRDSIFSH